MRCRCWRANSPPQNSRALALCSSGVSAMSASRYTWYTCASTTTVGRCDQARTRRGHSGILWYTYSGVLVLTLTSFYGSFCANNGEGALNTPDTYSGIHTQAYSGGLGCSRACVDPTEGVV
eukprot:3558358-Pyramimonas_sp.AAC.1